MGTLLEEGVAGGTDVLQHLAVDDERNCTTDDAGEQYPYFPSPDLWKRIVEGEQLRAEAVLHLGTGRRRGNDFGGIQPTVSTEDAACRKDTENGGG